MQRNPKCFFFNKFGKKITENAYGYSGIFQDDLAIVSKEGKYGIINKTGEIIVPLQYNYIRGRNENNIEIYDPFYYQSLADLQARSSFTDGQLRMIHFQESMAKVALKEPFQEGFTRVLKIDTLIKEQFGFVDKTAIYKWGFINN